MECVIVAKKLRHRPTGRLNFGVVIVFGCISIDFNRSRIWVEEEGEVFRKGTVLLGPAEMEGEYPGEELRKEVRDFQVRCI